MGLVDAIVGGRGCILGLAVVLSGCATTSDSMLAVKHVDRGQFEITSHAIGSLAGATDVQAKDDRIATKFCADKGEPMTIVARHGYGGLASQDILTFRCGNAVRARTVTPVAPGTPAPVAALPVPVTE